MGRFITAAELKDLRGADQVERLAALHPGGTTSTSAAIERAIAGAEGEVLSLLLPRYRSGGSDKLPTTAETTPGVLKDKLADVVLYHLARPANRISEILQRSYELALKWFMLVGRGGADIGLSETPAVDSSAPGFIANKGREDMVFGNGGLDDW